VRDTPTTEGFDRPWANRKCARRLVLALRLRVEDTPTMGRTCILDLIGNTPISGHGGCTHKHVMEYNKWNKSQYKHNRVD